MGMLFRYHKIQNNTVEDKETKGVTAEVAPEVSKAEEIKSLKGEKLRKYAKENGIENPEEYTAGELKAVLLEKLG